MFDSLFQWDFVYKIGKYDWTGMQFISVDVVFHVKKHVVKFISKMFLLNGWVEASSVCYSEPTDNKRTWVD